MPAAGWHHADIVAAVKKRGSNLRRLARAHKLGDSTLRGALLHPSSSRPSCRIIAAFIGVPVHVLWPAVFDADGGYRQPARPKASTARRASESPNRTAA
jgi:Ner family transcriptional regulator